MSGLVLVGQGEFASVEAELATLSPEDARKERRSYINWVEEELLLASEGKLCADLEHRLVDGLYYRSMRCPAGTMLTGYVHKKAGLSMLQSGSISIMTEHGVSLLKGPLVFDCPAGIRRLGYCHEEVVWTNVFAVTGKTLGEIESELFQTEYLENL